MESRAAHTHPKNTQVPPPRAPSEWQSRQTLRQTWPGRRQRNVAKAWKWGVFGLHAGQCVCGLKMNKLIGTTSHCLCTFSTSIWEIREIKYYFNIWGIRKKKKEGGSEKGGVKIHPFDLPWIRAWFVCIKDMRSIHPCTGLLIFRAEPRNSGKFAKFTKTPKILWNSVEILSNTCLYNLFETYFSY